VVAGLDLGLEEVRLAICHHGRDLDGCLALAEDGGGGATHIILGSAQGFHGFQDGGGRIHYMDMDYPVTGTHIQLTAGATGAHGTRIL